MVKVTVYCSYCGKPKELAKPSDVRPHNFCNRICMGMYERNRTTIKCQQCGREYVMRKGVAFHKSGHVRKYCSAKCKYEAIAQRYIGEGNPMYKPPELHSNPYYGENWRKVSKTIKQRDQNTCQHCGKKRTKSNRVVLHVHHIRPLREFDGDYERANNPQNLITLCESCHRKVEVGKISIQPKLL